MANLSNAQAIELIKTPKNQKEIQRALAARPRYSLHVETETDTECLGLPGHARFLKWVEGLVGPNENFERFKQLYRPPLNTNEFTESIFSEFQKIFEAENPFEKFNFKTPELESEFNEFRKRIGDNSFWETQGFETFKNGIDNILVVDMPAPDENNLDPEPYYYILDLDRLIDIDNKKVRGSKQVKINEETSAPAYYFKTEYIIFRDKHDQVCVIDDTYYRRYLFVAGQVPELIAEAEHFLGYCPARSFWTTPLNSKTNIRKASPITNSLSELDWLLFYELSAKYLKLYAPFPIYAMYRGTCNYKDEANKKQCRDGYLVGPNSPKDFISQERCPKCKNKIKIGAGNILELKAPQSKDDPDLLANPVKVIPADEVSVKVVNDEIFTRRASIKAACVGVPGEPANTQAKNELQILAGFESQTNNLLKAKRNFEIIKAFALETCARLKYADAFISLTIDFGDQFFVTDETAQLDEYKKAVDNGLPSFDLAMRRNKIAQVKYRNNPDLLNRYNILRNLDPFPDNTVKETLDMYKAFPEGVDVNDVKLKLNFNKFIDRFEREQADLTVFGSALDFSIKIKRMYDVLVTYVDEAAFKMLMEEQDLNAPVTEENKDQDNPELDRVHEILRKLSRKETNNLKKHVDDFKAGRTTIEQASMFLKAFKLSDEQIKLYLGSPEPAPAV